VITFVFYSQVMNGASHHSH